MGLVRVTIDRVRMAEQARGVGIAYRAIWVQGGRHRSGRLGKACRASGMLSKPDISQVASGKALGSCPRHWVKAWD